LITRAIQIPVVVLLACIATANRVAAQDHDRDQTAGGNAWSFASDANFIGGYNYQQRKFADFWAWESPNWVMASAERQVGRGRLTLNGMFSLEPWTIGRLVYAHGLGGPERVYAFDSSGRQQPIGASPQVYQTGESYLGSPLINYQHPHDLFMELGAAYRFGAGRARYTIEADLVGAPALGPPPFMHRESARDNPSVPLTHHYMDSTHITPGVVTGGVAIGPFMAEASAFRGEEPNDNRLDIDIYPFCSRDEQSCLTPRLDSWSLRGSWHRGPWSAQVSGGRLHVPEWFEPVDVIRTTASIGFTGDAWSRPLAVTVGWGHNRDVGLFALDGYLAEWDWRLSRENTCYGRAESMVKEIFGLGVHPAGLINHPRNFSQIDSLTLGYVRELPMLGWDRLGIGADITVYKTSQDLVEYYGSPKSYHVFLRWRPSGATPAHIH